MSSRGSSAWPEILPHGTASCEDYYCFNPFHEHEVYGWPACAADEWAGGDA